MFSPGLNVFSGLGLVGPGTVIAKGFPLFGAVWFRRGCAAIFRSILSVM